MRTTVFFVIVLWISCALGAGAQTVDLTDLAIEDLLEIEVTSVSRHEQKLSHAASAVYVITGEDIRRSGATSIPDALRMAPGVHVAQLGASQWSVSVRGFGGRFSDKLLVMVDGRSVYNPVFSGVYWEALDMPLEDIDRIEVVRGPGGAVWGSNAVNGVVHIITKSSSETQGALAVSGYGNREGPFSTARYGGAKGDKLHYRMYSKAFSRRAQLRPSGEEGQDPWAALRGGFRVDWAGLGGDSLTLSGDLYRLSAEAEFYRPFHEPPYLGLHHEEEPGTGGHLQARYSRQWSPGSRGTFQLYHDRYSRRSLGADQKLVESNDFDYQHELEVNDRHQLVFGGGARVNRDRLVGTEFVSFHPSRRTTHVWQGFVNDDFWLVRDQLRLSVGVKLEHNSYTDWQTQPSASLLWDRGNNETLWASVSRAVTLPSRVDSDVRVFAGVLADSEGPPIELQFIGRPDARSETLRSVEAGYRRKLGGRIAMDVALYRHSFGRIQVLEPGDVFLDVRHAEHPHLVLPLYFANQGRADSIGVETVLTWKPHSRVGFQGSYSFAQFDDRTLTTVNSISVAAPRHMVHGRASLRLPWGLEWSPSYYFVNAMVRSIPIPAYHRMDSRIAWKRTERWELSFGLQNIFDDRHIEGVSESLTAPQEIGRSVYGKITYGF